MEAFFVFGHFWEFYTITLKNRPKQSVCYPIAIKNDLQNTGENRYPTQLFMIHNKLI
jgi:hypothetical protein